MPFLKGARLGGLIGSPCHRELACYRRFPADDARKWGAKVTDDTPDRNLLDEDERIDTLQQRIDAATHKETGRTKVRASETDGNYRLGNRVLADLIGGIGGGAFVGWVIDRFAGTTPWALLVFLFLGIVVAFRNIIRISSGGSDK